MSEVFIYDLISALRKDKQRAQAVTEALQHLDIVALAHSNGKAGRDEIARAEAALVPLCGFNFGLLVPRVFPRYPLDRPLNFCARPFMFVMTAMTPGSTVTLRAGRQVGKCVDGDTAVETDTGERLTMKNIFDMGIPTALASRSSAVLAPQIHTARPR